MKKFEAIIEDRKAELELISREGNKVKIRIDNKEYEVDVVRDGNGLYSIIAGGISYDIDVVDGDLSKHFIVNSNMNEYRVEIIDAESRYQKARKEAQCEDAAGEIISPMPGKVVDVFVKKGDQVKAGQTLITISAMKMESEYKSPIDGVVKKLNVRKDDVVNAQDLLIKIS